MAEEGRAKEAPDSWIKEFLAGKLESRTAQAWYDKNVVGRPFCRVNDGFVKALFDEPRAQLLIRFLNGIFSERKSLTFRGNITGITYQNVELIPPSEGKKAVRLDFLLLSEEQVYSKNDKQFSFITYCS